MPSPTTSNDANVTSSISKWDCEIEKRNQLREKEEEQKKCCAFNLARFPSDVFSFPLLDWREMWKKELKGLIEVQFILCILLSFFGESTCFLYHHFPFCNWMVEWLKHSCISIHTMTINDQPKTPPRNQNATLTELTAFTHTHENGKRDAKIAGRFYSANDWITTYKAHLQ